MQAPQPHAERPAEAARRSLGMTIHRFADGWAFDAASGELHRDGTLVRLEPQPAALLALLAGRPGELVTHDDIRRAVWGDATHVDFREGTHYGIRQVRRALGDPARGSRVIETVPRRGYRLRVDALASTAATSEQTPEPVPELLPESCSELFPEPCSEPPPGPAAGSERRRRWAVAAIAAAVLFAIAEQIRPETHHAIAVSIARALHDAVY
jgi:DNA-binding winged helix-turn-helix (wHTH) protein